jgi:hypothetical protein
MVCQLWKRKKSWNKGKYFLLIWIVIKFSIIYFIAILKDFKVYKKNTVSFTFSNQLDTKVSHGGSNLELHMKLLTGSEQCCMTICFLQLSCDDRLIVHLKPIYWPYYNSPTKYTNFNFLLIISYEVQD